MNLPFLILYTATIIYLYLTFHTFRYTRTRMGIVYMLICVSMFFWSITTALLFIAPNKEMAFFWIKLSSFGWAFLPGLLLHFSLLLTQREGLLQNKILLLYLPGPLFIITEIFGGYQAMDFSKEIFGWHTIPKDTSPIFWAFNMYYTGYLIISILLIYKWGKNTKKERFQRQAKTITPSLIFSFFLVLLNETFLPLLGYTLPKVPGAIGLIYAITIWHGITKHRLLEVTKELTTHEIIASIQDMMLLVNQKTLIMNFNPRVAEVLNLTEKELKGLPFLSLVKEEPPLWQDFLKGERDYFQKKIYVKRKKKDPLPVQLYATSIRNRARDLTGLVLILHDLSENYRLEREIRERKRFEEDLKVSNKRLLEISQVKTDFLSTASHELRTPLTSILGFAHIIKKRYEDIIVPGITKGNDQKINRSIRQIEENINIIVAEGRHLTNLINDVLTLARMESSRIEWEKDPLKIEDLIQESVEKLSTIFSKKGLLLHSKVEEDLPLLFGDAERLKQVLENLLSNALKFTYKGGVNVIASKRKKELLIEIKDTGPGIPEEDLEGIFDKFKQMGDTLTDKPQGAGLGLPICREIIKHHKGKIWAESTLSQGSSFFFTLPFGEEEELEYEETS